MNEVADFPLLAAAVKRDNGKCVVCGSPCGPHDARRRIDAASHGDCADNWSAMCRPCRDFLDGKAPPPAQYVAHIYDAPKFRRRIRQAWGWALAGLALASWLVLAGIVGWLIKNAIDSPLDAFISAVSILFLLSVAMNMWTGWRGGRHRHPVQHIHHTHAFNEQTVWVRESR